MRVRFLPVLLILAACSYKIEGPTPVVGGAQNERDNSTAPAYLCNAQGDPTGWLVDVLGDKFAPLPTGSLVHTAGVTMPTVSFAGPENYTLPAPYVHFIDKTRMPLAMRTGTSETDPHALTPGDYTITVTNLNGASGTSPAAALRVIPPPSETQVQVQPAGGTIGAANVCNDQSQSLIITGTGFRTAAPPTVAFLGAGSAPVFTLPASAVTVNSATQITATIPAGSFPAALPGGATYTVSVTDPAGCVAPFGSVARGFGITDVRVFSTCKNLGTLALNPRFGWTNKNQSVTISNSFSASASPPTVGFSGGAPTVTILAPIVGSTTPVSIPLRRVAFINANTITAVIPTCSGTSSTPFSQLPPATCTNGIAAGGPYTISIQDPNGAKGTLSGAQGFVVVPNEPPVIASIAPTAIDTTGTGDLLITSGGLTGTNFGTALALAKPQIVFQAGNDIRACDLPINGSPAPTTSAIHATVPTSVAQANCVEYDPTGAQVAATGGFTLGTGLYVIRVQDTADPANGDYSGLVVTQPSKKPSASQDAGAALIQARADAPLVQATDDIGNQYLYVLGGIDGPLATGTALSSIEVAQITEFGTLGSFSLLDRTALGYVGGTGTTAAPRHGLGAVAVTVPGDTSYIFVLGGINGSGYAITNVERAQVLKAGDAPVINSPIAVASGGQMAAGTYYYKVSALLGTGDAKNPGGETLASDIEPASVAASGTATVTWPCIASAVGYRVFRTVNANDPAGTEQLLASPANAVTACTGSPLPNESFTDSGSTMPAGKKPQPAGALGRWVAQTSLPTPRGEAAVKRVGDRIFAAGGCTTVTSTPTCNGTGGETATIDIANLTAAAVASYGSATLTAPRRRASITIANKLTAPGEFTSLASNLNDQWLMVLYGDAAAGNPNGPSGSDAAKVIANGSAVAAPTFANTAYGPTGFGVTGGWGEAIADLLLVFGNTGSTGFDFRVPQGSTTICGGGACTAASSFTATLTSSGAGAITNRYLPGEVLFRAYVYAAGGLTNATSAATAQATVDRIVY